MDIPRGTISEMVFDLWARISSPAWEHARRDSQLRRVRQGTVPHAELRAQFSAVVLSLSQTGQQGRCQYRDGSVEREL